MTTLAGLDFTDVPAGLPNGLGLMLWPLDWPRPLELTTGHDVLCTARYDSEGICVGLEQCAPVDAQVYLGTPPCSCWYVRASDTRHPHPCRWAPASEAGDCYCGALVFWINVNCWHHGDGFRW